MLECILIFRSGLAMTLSKEGSDLRHWMGPLCDYDIPFMGDIAIRPTDRAEEAKLGMGNLDKYGSLIQCPVSDMMPIPMGAKRIEPSANHIYYCKPVLKASDPNYAIYAVFVLPAQRPNFNRTGEETLAEILPYNVEIQKCIDGAPEELLSRFMQLGHAYDSSLIWHR